MNLALAFTRILFFILSIFFMNVSWIYWDPNPQIFEIPFLHIPIFWYSLFFAFGFIVGFPLFVQILGRFLFLIHPKTDGLKQKATKITDRFALYIIIATIVGARLGHFLFYEDPSEYLSKPWELLKTWEGGLASHGAAVSIVIAVILFARSVRAKEPALTWIRLLDFLAVPAAFGGFCIRLGNFINQEVLGTPSTLPWAVIFGHPADRSEPVPRHPVQIYEALFYLVVFFLLWSLSFRPKMLRSEGKLIGLFLILVFGFRFLIEFLKLEQSHIMALSSQWTMAQYLSLPFIALGFFLFFRKR